MAKAGALVTAAWSWWRSWPLEIQIWALPGGFATTILVGMIAGLYRPSGPPAWPDGGPAYPSAR